MATERSYERALLEEMRTLVQDALESRRHVIVYELAVRLQSAFDAAGTAHSASTANDSQWIPIESLSGLRQLVGGRFQNLKDRWVQAGFPLREHRGDRSGRPELQPDGWLELVSWMGKNGYEARLLEDAREGLFEIRKTA